MFDHQSTSKDFHARLLQRLRVSLRSSRVSTCSRRKRKLQLSPSLLKATGMSDKSSNYTSSGVLLAALLAQLITTVRQNLWQKVHHVKAFSDSMTALASISGDPSRWKTFTANRVSTINSLLPDVNWRHISTHENPADLLSRGAAPITYTSNQLWWAGSTWQLDEQTQPQPCSLSQREEQQIEKEWRKTTETTSYFLVISNTLDNIINKFSSLQKLIRVTAWIFHFVTNCQLIPEDRETCPLTIGELNAADRMLIRYTQHQAFDTKITALNLGKPLPTKSKLWPLSPLLDCGLLRVGGQLARSELSYKTKHLFSKQIQTPDHNLNKKIQSNFGGRNVAALTQHRGTSILCRAGLCEHTGWATKITSISPQIFCTLTLKLTALCSCISAMKMSTWKG